MISNDRKEELEFQIRNRIPIRMTDSVSKDRLETVIADTDIKLDLSDIYTLRDLCEAGIITLGPLNNDGVSQTIETTFYESVKITNNEGDTITILQHEIINIAVDNDIVEDLQPYIGY